MPISPLPAGSQLPVMQVQLLKEGATPYQPETPVDLTGLFPSNFSMNLYNTNTGTDQAGNGVFVISDAVNGIIQYAWDVTDTATAGAYELFISAMFAGGPLIWDGIPLTIVPK